MSRARSLVSFASWNYGAQAGTIALQFGYAAVTSRLVDDVGFGAYAVALSVSALITLLANGGLGQAVSRMQTLDSGRISALALSALALGGAGAVILLMAADFAAQLWATPAAADPIRVLAVAALVSPLGGLMAGLLRRQQRFRALAAIVVGSNATGMLVGVLAVIVEPGPVALVVSPTTTMLILVIATVMSNRTSVFSRPRFRAVGSELRFSWNVTGLSVLSYLNVNIGRWALSRGVGADVLGQWNRADVLTTVPLEQTHRAVQQAIYPEFRHDIGGNSRTREVWTDLLILIAWLAFPLAALVGVVAPAAIPILFGPGWDLAARLAFPLAIILAVQMLSTTLGAALEAVGRFRWILTTHLVGLAIHIAGAVVAIVLSEWWPVLTSLAASHLIQHAIQTTLSSRQKMLNASRLVSSYLQAMVFAGSLGTCIWMMVAALRGHLDAWIGIVLLAVLAAAIAIGLRYRSKLPPLRILEGYLRQ